MTEAKHSPLPWHTGGIFNPTSPQPTVNTWTEAKLGNASGNIVAERVPVQEAEFIILATSLHAELVAGLEEISSLDFGVCGDIARTLIQKAKRP